MDSGDMLYWFFSTIAQTYGAIIAIIGLLVVYRLDNQNRLRGAIRERLLEPRRRIMPEIFGEKAYGWSPDVMVDKFQEPNDKDKSKLKALKNRGDEKYPYLFDEMKRINNSIVISKRIRVTFLFFIGFHLICIIIPSLLAIFYTVSLKNYEYSIFGAFIIILIISCGLTALLVWFLLKTVKKDAPLKKPVEDE